MSGRPTGTLWITKAWQAVLAVLAIAIAARVAWSLLSPFIPILIGVGIILLLAQLWRRNFW